MISAQTSRLTDAKEGLPKHMIGKVQVYKWKSKGVIHKKMQTVSLIHTSDIRHIIPDWKHSYEVDNFIIIRESEFNKLK